MMNITKLPEKLSPYFTEGVRIILWFFLVASAVIFLLHGLLSVSFPYSLDYGEAPLVDQAIRLAAGENIYRPSIETPPYTIANYPPVYVISLIPGLSWFGSPFVMGRIISLVATLLSAFFIGMILFNFTQDRLSALVAALLFLASPYVVQWSGRARIDSLALAFATAALYVLVRWPRLRWAWLGSGVLLVLAVYTRQSYALAAPLAAFVWLWTHSKQRAIALALLVGGLGLGLFFLINALTDGGFYYNIVTANVNEFGWDRLEGQLRRLWSDGWIALLMGVLFLAIGWRSQKSWALIAPFLVGAFGSAMTIGKIGSNVNYFLEMAAALALIAGIAVVWSRSFTWGNVAVLLLISIQFGTLFRSSMQDNVDWILGTHYNDFDALEFLEQDVKKMADPILADEDMGLLTMNGRPLYIQPFEVTQLANAGMWDEQPLLDEIAARNFDGILIHFFGAWPVHKERWSPKMLAAIEANYRPEKTLAGTVVYLPKSESEIASIPTPGLSAGEVQPPAWDGQAIPLGDASVVLDPSITINPTDPNNLVAIATRFSRQDCELPNCKVELALYDSTDGGQTWDEAAVLKHGQQVMYAGQVAFDSSGNLNVLAIRGSLIILNQASLQDEYPPTQAGFADASGALVYARPWLRVDPDTGEVFLSFDAQEGDRQFVTPSLIRSKNGLNWSLTARADQHVSVLDVESGRASMLEDIQTLFGAGDRVSLVWTWDSEPWTWPRTIWIANSDDNGVTFGEPTPLAKTWGPINSVSDGDKIAIVYRSGIETKQSLVVATSDDNGRSWHSTIASEGVPLIFDVEVAPGISIGPEGTIDLVFYAKDDASTDCVRDVADWQLRQPFGGVDFCEYDVFYTYSTDGGLSFAEPMQLNREMIRGEDFARMGSYSQAGAALAVASSEGYAYPMWIGTPQLGKTQIYTARIER